MLSTLKAVVQGERIQWQEDTGNVIDPDRQIEVLVTILENGADVLASEERGRRRVAALQKLAALNGFSNIQDPVQWQQEAREERSLPGREA